jgi:hypothetical protein
MGVTQTQMPLCPTGRAAPAWGLQGQITVQPPLQLKVKHDLGRLCSVTGPNPGPVPTCNSSLSYHPKARCYLSQPLGTQCPSRYLQMVYTGGVAG